MIIQCDKCSTRYRIDDSRVTGSGVKVRCNKCQNVFVVSQPDEEAPIEEVLGAEKGKGPASDRPSAKSKEKPAEKPSAKKALDNETLKFNFDRPPDESAADTAAANDAGSLPFTDSPIDKNDLGLGAQENETAPAEPPAPTSGRKNHFEDIDFGIGQESDKAGEQPDDEAPGETGEWNIGSGGETADSKTEEKPAERPGEEPAAPPVAAPGPLDDEGAEPKAAWYTDVGRPTGKLDDLLSASSAGGVNELDDRVLPSVPPPPPQRSEVKYYIIALAVALIAAAALYFTGASRMLTGRFETSATAPHEEPVKIDTVRGYFVDNKNIGRVFVIEAWVKNISDSPQDIREIRGVLYDNGGDKIKVQSVSPGRVISTDDIKNLSKDDILKQYKDVSGGTVPPKGAVPVTIVFTDVPQGMTEYGIEVVRGRS